MASPGARDARTARQREHSTEGIGTPDFKVEVKDYDRRGRWDVWWWGRRPGSSQGTAAPVTQTCRTRRVTPWDRGSPTPRHSSILQSDRARHLVQSKPITSDAVERRLLRRGLRPRWLAEPPPSFTGLSMDSREIERGHLFCAVEGTRVDGHSFLPEAERAGASAALVEHPVSGSSLPQLEVTDSRLGTAHLAALFCGDPADELALVGVTGTNGKSTTVWLTRHLLSDLAPSAAIGTIGVVRPTGAIEPGGLTTPDPIALTRTLVALKEDGCRNASLEVSSHALDQRRADALRFAAVVFTSFSREHLEYHSDLDEYLAAKLRLAELLLPGGLCAVNADEPAWLEVSYEEGRLWRYGLAAAADVRAVDLELQADSSRWRLVTPVGEALVELPMPGEFNVRNALGAATVALDAGLVPERIAELLGGSPPVPGRMEVLRRTPSIVLRDYAHTPDSYERVLSSLRTGLEGRLIVVFGCGGDRDPGKRPLMGETATRLADFTIVTSDNPRSEDPEAIIGQIVSGLDATRYEIVLDRREAIARALDVCGPKDVVVLLGKGHETYQIEGDRRVPFDEAAIVAELSASEVNVEGRGGAPW